MCFKFCYENVREGDSLIKIGIEFQSLAPEY